MAFLKLIRWKNLIIVALTQYLIYFRLLLPNFNNYDITPELSTASIYLLFVVTLILTACGYIINDILDQKTDHINKPQKRIIGKSINEQTASWFYILLGLLGFIISIYLGFETQNVNKIGLYPFSFLLLLLYSSFFKKRPLVGNIIVALFCSAVCGIVWLAEWNAFQNIKIAAPLVYQRIFMILLGYMIFAFLATMYREIIKDLEDMEGDKIVNFKTLPIAWGSFASKILSISFGILLIILFILGATAFKSILNTWILLFGIVGIIVPLLFSFVLVWRAEKTDSYNQISLLIKIILLNGLILLFLISL